MQSNRPKSNTKVILLGISFLFGFINVLFISMNGVKLYYEPIDDESNHDLQLTTYYTVKGDNTNDNNRIQEKQVDDDDGGGDDGGNGFDVPPTENNADDETKNNQEGRHIVSSMDDTAKPPELSLDKYDATSYIIQLQQALKPMPNLPTAAYLHVFWSGFCNQYYMFSGVLLLAKASNYSQIIVQSIRWKDLFGTNENIRHDFFFDVVHWNTFYPKLPRFVNYEKSLHSQIDITSQTNDERIKPNIKWNIDNPFRNATKPYAIGEKRTDAIMTFFNYTKDIDKGRSERDESELLIMKNALQPHPAIRDIMSTFKREHHMTKMMVLHARIEPDMQKHPMCKQHKVLNITDIVNMLYEKYPEPPVSTVLIILNRAILEKEVSNPKKENDIATHNLKTLNEIILNGLWDGRVKVVEAGSGLARESKYPFYSKYSSLVGSIINFFLSLEAEIFIGTIVSSYSTAVISYRFFREKKENYFYLPKGLDLVTPPGTKEPPRFAC